MPKQSFEGKFGVSRKTGRWSDQTAKRKLPEHIDNIQLKYSQATPDDIARGRDWYATAHQIAHTLGKGNVHTGAGVLAALSPNMDWDRNIEGAHHVVNTGTHWRHQTADNNSKALRILAGEHPDDVLGGHKVKSFYRNIVNPEDPQTVTIDKHAHDIARGMPPGYRRKQDLDMGLSSKNRYDHFVTAYATATHRLGEAVPSQVQAITWTTHRRQKNV